MTSDQSSTKMMIEKYNQGKASHQVFFNKLYSETNQLLNQISIAWDVQDSLIILELVQKYNAYIKQLNEKFALGIYTDEHQKLINLANESEMFYKPSGAGGGDLGFILSNNEKELKEFIVKLRDSNFQTIDLR